MAEERPFQIGDSEAQVAWREDHKDFIGSFPTLIDALTIALDRDYSAKTVQDALIFDLSRLCADRFSEIGLLCANGLGRGASILLRSMFEHLVTARYIHMHPESANDFIDYFFIQMHKLHNQIERTFGSEYLHDEYTAIVQKNFERVRQRFLYTPKSNSAPRLKSGWTDMGTVDMAIHVGLGDYLVHAYSRPIEIAHPSMITLINDPQQRQHDASDALMIAHRLLIDLLILQHEHFGLTELQPLISRCLADFKHVWRRYQQQAPDISP
jgi:hypothetical protein